MKLFRINKVEEFFNSYLKANDILFEAEKRFINSNQPHKIDLFPEKLFSGEMAAPVFVLQSIVFVDGHELYYYDIIEEE
jgi:hypothetical protein